MHATPPVTPATAHSLHQRLVFFDGLVVSKWSPAIFAEMQRGGLTAANCTCCVWENFQQTMNNIAQWKRWLHEHPDRLLAVRTVQDIHAAKQSGRTGIILGFQNTSAFEDQIGYVQLFKELGVGIVQLTYNTQNLVGSGCYESRDGGLSDWGREVLWEMNRVGILCDLSHVGPQTSADAVRESRRPVVYSHCLPLGMKQHARNKSDAQLKAVADRGGLVGVTMFPPFLRKGTESTVEDYVQAIDYVVNLVGEDHVGIGTDFTEGYDDEFFRWITHDKGNARQLTEFGTILNPAGIRQLRDYPNLTAALERAGWTTGRIEKVLGLNWLQVLDEAWR